jgi:hypothetical protein
VTFSRFGRLKSWGIIGAACLSVLGGCATFAARAGGGCKERAQARWDAQVAGNWEKAYSFATPAYRKAVDLFGFRSRSAPAAKLKSADVVNVKCKDATCDVTMRIGFAPLQRVTRKPRPISRSVGYSKRVSGGGMSDSSFRARGPSRE